MAWGKVDDGLHKSVKWRRASKGARALWTTSLSWCMDELTDGFVPKDMLRVLDGTIKEATNLVEVGLWDVRRNGWKFHDWHEYQPDAGSIKAKKASQSVGAGLGNHRRWHVGRSAFVPGCEFCEGMPPDSDIEPPMSDLEHAENVSVDRSVNRRGNRIGSESPVPEPIPNPLVKVGGGGSVSNANEPPPPPTPEILDSLKEPWRCPDHQGVDARCFHCKAYKAAHKAAEIQRARDAKDTKRLSELAHQNADYEADKKARADAAAELAAVKEARETA